MRKKKPIPLEEYNILNVPLTHVYSDRDADVCIPYVSMTAGNMVNSNSLFRMIIGHKYILSGIFEDDRSECGIGTLIDIIRPLILSDETISYQNHSFIFEDIHGIKVRIWMRDIIHNDVHIIPLEPNDIVTFECDYKVQLLS